jgi:large subunit ribosomal protein L50
MQTLNDVKNFYQTPVDTITPLDKMRDMELPENLHVQFEYHRFHPGTLATTDASSSLNKILFQKLTQCSRDKLRLTGAPP